jgi:AcrR family transcriptional regulator
MPAKKSVKKKVSRKIPTSVAKRSRSYNSPLRQQQASTTRDRIVTAGADLARKLPIWDWRAMTFKAVGERAQMNERTVRRYFATERSLRDAIHQRHMQECGVDFSSLELADFADAAIRVHGYLLGFSFAPRETPDPGLTAMDTERRASLLNSIARATPSWSPTDRLIAAATLDVFWTPLNFERFSSAWKLDEPNIARLIRWAIATLQDAIKDGKRPKL